MFGRREIFSFKSFLPEKVCASNYNLSIFWFYFVATEAWKSLKWWKLSCKWINQCNDISKYKWIELNIISLFYADFSAPGFLRRENFFVSEIFPGDWGFLSRALETFQNVRIYIPGIGDFYPGIFCGWGFFGDGDIPPKSHLWTRGSGLLSTILNGP